MKTAISVPDGTFHRVERRVGQLGVSRSEFYATAAVRYLDELDQATLTAQIDEALARGGRATVDESREFAARSRDRLAELAKDDDW